jgi:hypothetical protein
MTGAAPTLVRSHWDRLYDISGTVCLDNVDVGGITVNQEKGLNAEFLAALINSSVLNFVFLQTAAPFRGGYYSANRQFIEPLPLPSIDIVNPDDKVHHDTIVLLYEWIAWIYLRLSIARNTEDSAKDVLIANYFEQWLNALVCELYFPTELHEANLFFFDLVQAEGLRRLELLSEADRLPCLRRLFEISYAPDHKLRLALYRLGSLDLVRVIEGKA